MSEFPIPVSFSLTRPPGDDRVRRRCDQCGWVDYVNPRIVVGSVVESGAGLLLCRRAIEPRRGYWTLPAGFLEEGESVEEGARREAREEACADIEIDRILAIYSITRISQIQIMFLARLRSDIAAGPESEEVGLFRDEDIPWGELAFPSVRWAIQHARAAAAAGASAPFTNPEPA